MREADIAGNNTNGENVLWTSSRAKIIPAKGELKAAAKPAEAPAVIKNSSLAWSFSTNLLANPSPIDAPIWTEGPSLPTDKPTDSEINPPRNL